ncbi:hypothetical protein [Coleofasciculus sp. G2-EDA-02]|uniref:hypothetical protein n=1 Tax=Coleofasciculus sp. G2-EDA-02 TaxID=3069529 RepID=UPI0032F2E03A
MLNAQLMSEVLEEIGERAVVLIVSDAGAARGNFDQERIESTKVWIKQVQQSVRYCAWLNQCQINGGKIPRLEKLPVYYPCLK